MAQYIRFQKRMIQIASWFLASGQRLALSLFIIFCLPLFFLLYETQMRTSQFTEKNIIQQNTSVSRLASQVVAEHFEGLIYYVESFVKRRMLMNHLVNRNADGIMAQLEDVVSLKTSISSASICSPSGKILYTYPNRSMAVGEDCSKKDWYLGVSSSGKSYVSEIYLSTTALDTYAVYIATPVRTKEGGVLGYLIAEHPIRGLMAWLTDIQNFRSASVHVLDHHGRLATKPGERSPIDPDLSDNPLIEKIRTQANGWMKARDPVTGTMSFMSYTTLEPFGWTVIVSQKAGSALAPARVLRRALLMMGGISFLVMLVLGTLWLYVLRSYHKMILRQKVQLEETQEQFKDIKEHLNNIINAVADPIFVKDRHHRFNFLNDECCRMIGRSREELIGKSDYDFFPKEEADIFWQKDEQVFRTGQENINEENITDSSGMTHTIVTKKALYTDKNGQKYIVGTIRDITKERMTEKEMREKNEALIRSREENQELEKLAVTDPLTGLLNRRGLQQALVREVQWARREESELVAMMIDLDDFKSVNDDHGHSTGDSVLRQISIKLKNYLRTTDYVGRIGGDEFLVLMPSTNMKDAAIVAEKIRKGIEAKTFIAQDTRDVFKVTASFGVRIVKMQTSSLGDLIADIQYSLRKSKVSGKNRVDFDN